MPSEFERLIGAFFGPPASKPTKEDVWTKVTTTFNEATKPAVTPLGPITAKTIDGEKYLLATDVLKNLIEEGQGSCRTAKQISKYLHG